MLEILGKLGIDINMLIAQIINFTALLWILNKLVYKPIIDQVEKNETELTLAEKEKKEFLLEKENFEKEKKETLQQMKKKSQTIIHEAKQIASKLNEEAQEEVKKLKDKLVKQAREQVDREKKSLTKKKEREKSLLIVSSLKENIQERVCSQPELEKQLNQAFFDLLIEKIKSMPKEDIIEHENDIPENERATTQLLEFASPLTKLQLKTLQKIFKKEEIVTKQNKDLISGFRFEIDGFLIESNLLYEITKAYEQ